MHRNQPSMRGFSSSMINSSYSRMMLPRLSRSMRCRVLVGPSSDRKRARLSAPYRFCRPCYARGFHRRKHAARSAARTARNETHDLAHSSSSRRRDDLIEHLRRQVEFDLRLHQLAFEVADRRRRERHLKRRHLARVTLAVSDQREVVSRYLLARDDRRLPWRECAFTAALLPFQNSGSLRPRNASAGVS